MKTEQQHREDIVRFGKMLHQTGLVAATDGNISVRLADGTILSTPTFLCKGMMEPEDLVIVDSEGRRLKGARNVSSEIAMHLLIYARRPEVGGIVHAHPPTATGFAAAGIALDRALCAELIVTLGSVPLAGYATPGTPELVHVLSPLVADHNAILMANHGVVAYGEDLLSAYMFMETVEHFAKIALVTHMLGREQTLSETHIDKLREVRTKYLANGRFVAQSKE